MNKQIFRTEIFFYIAFLLACVFILLQSPLAPYAKSSNGIDSSVYIYSAQQILKGQTMYRDIVDHKGPFLYLINVVALFIFKGKFIGVWIFEIIALFTTSIMMYKTARFFAGKISSFFAVITAILFLVPLIIGGNNAEEWALPFISVALYIFVAYLKENKPLTIIWLAILSLTFVLTFMIRVNLAALWVGFGIVLLIKWIVEKKHKELIRNVLFLLFFIFLFLLPFFLYIYFRGALSDALYLVFKFNMFEYEPNTISLTLKRCFKILTGVYFLSAIPFIIMTYMLFRKKTAVNWSVLLAFVFTALACSLGRRYQHYFMIFAPLLAIPYAYIFDVIKESIRNKVKYPLLFTLFILYNYNPAIIQAQNIVDNYSENGYGIGVISPPTREMLKKIILQNTTPEDKILVNGLQSSLYLYSGRTCAIRFPYPLMKSSFAKKYYVEDAEKALPKLIIRGDIVNSLGGDDFNLDSLINNKYQLIPTCIDGVEIWKLKDSR